MSDKNEFLKQFEKQIENWNSQIKEMEANMDKAKADAKIKYEENLRVMREERDKARDKLSELQKSNDAAWDDMKKGAEDMWGAMEDSFKKALSRFR